MEPLTVTQLSVDPSIRGGRPHVTGTRITVSDIVLMHLRLGQTLEEIAGKHDLPLAGLHAAMAYYDGHRAEIDGAIEDDEAFQEASRRENPALLQEKLASLRRGA